MKKIIARVLSIALVSAMALSLVACGGTTTSTPAPTQAAVETTPATMPEATGNKKDTLNIGVTSLWATLSPFQTTQNQYGTFTRLLYDRLAVVYNGEYVPQMAESWEVAEDGVTWTVKIHDNITDRKSVV